jgi:trimeric autotransporter adhesin
LQKHGSREPTARNPDSSRTLSKSFGFNMPGHFLIFPKSRWLVLSILLFSYLPDLNAQTINTFAGDRTGDGGPATSAYLGGSLGIALDRHGNLYIADPNNHRIRKVNTSEGTISTIAGTGQAGYNEDSKLATRATLNYPSDIAFDTLGNLYIADRANRRIRKINGIDGTISTVAGNGLFGYNGDGGLATEASLMGPLGIALDAEGNIYFSDENNVVRKIANGIINTIAGVGWYGFEGDGGPATQARLAGPSRLVIDTQGNLLIADTNNHRIRKVDRNSGIISTIAGNGNYQYSGDGGPAINAGMQSPTSIGLDTAGNLFISERFGNRIRKINHSDGNINTIAGNGSSGFGGDGGSPLQASLASPVDVAVSSTGILYIADQGNHRIRRINADGSIISSIAGYGYLQSGYCGDKYMASSACLNQPKDVAVDTLGNVYIADKYNFVIRKVNRDGIITTIAGNGSYGFSGDGGPAIKATLTSPNSVAVDRAGNIFIADQDNYRVRKVAVADGIITTVAGNGSYEHSGDGGPAINAGLRSVSAIALDDERNLYILDQVGVRVRKVNAESGIISTVAGNGTNGFSGDGGLAINASFNYPMGITLDNTGNLYIADRQNHRIRKVDALTGIITTIAGTGTNGFSGDGGPATNANFSLPSSVSVDAFGNIFISDQANGRIRKITRQDGLVKTVAGNGISWFAGDGGPATDASLYNPEGIAVDKAGTIYIADTQTHRIRAVSQTIISLKNGSWADPAVWNLGRIPTTEDHVIVDQNHKIMVTDQAVTKGIEYRANAQILFSETASSIHIGQ